MHSTCLSTTNTFLTNGMEFQACISISYLYTKI
jgi:hypothetical protein